MKKKCFITEHSVTSCKVLFLAFYENGNTVMHATKGPEISLDFYISSLVTTSKKALFSGDKVTCMTKLLIFYLV